MHSTAIARVWPGRDAIARHQSVPLPRKNGEEAQALGRGFITGRWSPVDQFESDGRRYLIAKKNDPETQASAALTIRQQQVLSYAALGRSGKFIAYELGIPQSSISASIKCACVKLGVRSRTELIRLFASHPATLGGNDDTATKIATSARPHHDEVLFTSCRVGTDDYVVWSNPLSEAAIPSVLTSVERLVFQAILSGSSNAEIALDRGRSRNTIANQVAAIFRKLGVGSRAELVAKHGALTDGPSADGDPVDAATVMRADDVRYCGRASQCATAP